MILEKKDILNVGVGEAGGNLVNELMSLENRYANLCINSNEKDTQNLDHITDKYIIRNAMGTGKNRTRGKQIFVNDRKNITDQILKYKTQRVINIYFGMGGGTGSSIAPSIIKSLNILGIKDKIINVICIKPASNEDKRYRKNALECWNELISLNNITAFYILDNSTRRNIMSINKEFVKSFNLFMSMPKLEKTDNVIDAEELGVISLSKGAVTFYTLPNKKEDPKMALAIAEKNSIFAELDENNHRCEYLAMALNKDQYNYEQIAKLFKIKEFKVCGYNNIKDNSSNLIVATGLKLQKTAMEELELSLQEDEEDFKEEDVIDKEDLKIDSDVITKQEVSSINNSNLNDNDLEKKLDDDSLWESFLNM